MKILFVTHDNLGEDGGPRVRSLALIEGFIRQGHEVMLACPIETAWDGPGLLFQCSAFSVRKGNLVWRFLKLLTICGILSARILKLSKQADVIYAADHFAGAVAALRILNHGKPIVREINGFPFLERSIGNRGFLNNLYRYLTLCADRMSLTKSNRLIFVSNGLKNAFEKELHRSFSNAFVIGNGVHLEKFICSPSIREHLRSELNLHNTCVLIFIGSMNTWHGVDTLIHALPDLRKALPSIRAVLIGDGPTLSNMRKAALELGCMDIILWIGRINHEKIPEYLAAADIGISCHVPGLLGCPMKLREYLAAGLPVVQSDIEDTDFVESARLGVRFKAGDAGDLIRAVKQVLSDPELPEYSKKCREFARTNLSWDGIATRVMEVLKLATLDPRMSLIAAVVLNLNNVSCLL